jgi:3-phosphoshikimate 1-carboxyvinyltransferase
VRASAEDKHECPPVVIRADGLRGGRVRIKGDVSSQFLSGLMLAAPFARGDSIIEVKGPAVSWPYLYMTARMLWQWGLRIQQPRDLSARLALDSGDRAEWGERVREAPADTLYFEIPGLQHQPLEDQLDLAEKATLRQGLDPRHVWLRDYQIEPDASAASYFFGAAALMGGEITVPYLPRKSLQGDIRFVEILGDMGCEVEFETDGISVHGDSLGGIDADLNDISDTVMTLAAVACFAEGPTTIRNVAHIRHKETDRLTALATELRRVGAEVDEFPDGLKITPRPLHGAEIETYNDHRMAMSMALLGLRVPGVVIKDPACVAKTYPRFFEDLEKLRS